MLISSLCWCFANVNNRYIGFDFHQECKGMRYENVSKLTSQLEGDMKEYEYVPIDLFKASC